MSMEICKDCMHRKKGSCKGGTCDVCSTPIKNLEKCPNGYDS